MKELLLFGGGVLATLLAQAASYFWQVRLARRQERFAAISRYVEACTRYSTALMTYANTKAILESSLPLYETLSKEAAAARILGVWDAAHAAVKEGMTDVGTQAHLVNALFLTKVDPLGAANFEGAELFETVRSSFPKLPILPDARTASPDVVESALAAYRKAARNLSKYCGLTTAQLTTELEGLPPVHLLTTQAPEAAVDGERPGGEGASV